jgi:dTDP-4-dehydrorhamnose 3,5-epimerase
MDNEFIIKLEKHPTKSIIDQHENGSLTVIWRDWDDIIKNQPKMVYVSSVNKDEIKGPHIHKKRNSYFTCIHGKVIFVIKDNHGNYHEIESSEEKPVMVNVPKNYPSAHINISSGISRVLAMADISWKPNDDEMINTKFDDYDWTKWSTRD